MKRVHKRVFGFFGLVVVAVVTCIAIMLPSSGASATTSSVTDIITVRVVGDKPNVGIRGITNNAIYVNLDRNFAVDYEDVWQVTVSVEYTSLDDTTTKTIEVFEPDYNAGTNEYPLLPDVVDIDAPGHGYGKYVIMADGLGFGDVPDGDSITFYYLPLYASISEDADGETYHISLDYETGDDIPESDGKVAKIIMNVYNENGELVEALSPITVDAPGKSAEISMEGKGLPSGRYTVKIFSYNADGEEIYKPYILYYDYEVIVVPDTGTLFGKLNISRADYLITGLLVFSMTAILGIVVVAKNKNSKSRLGKKRR